MCVNQRRWWQPNLAHCGRGGWLVERWAGLATSGFAARPEDWEWLCPSKDVCWLLPQSNSFRIACCKVHDNCDRNLVQNIFGVPSSLGFSIRSCFCFFFTFCCGLWRLKLWEWYLLFYLDILSVSSLLLFCFSLYSFSFVFFFFFLHFCVSCRWDVPPHWEANLHLYIVLLNLWLRYMNERTKNFQR